MNACDRIARGGARARRRVRSHSPICGRVLGLLVTLGAVVACGQRGHAAAAAHSAQRVLPRGARGPRYDCHSDPALNFPVYVPPADTAGLGAVLAAHFAGYRLSTELEIGCRFPLTDGAQPMQYWPQWGSGTPWWIWHGDFDGDGKPDRLILLSLASDPAEDLLVVWHGNGTAARVVSPGGWGVAVVDANQARRLGVPGKARNAIAIVRWGQDRKMDYLFCWNGSAYVRLK
jgi:hypothetical protein